MFSIALPAMATTTSPENVSLMPSTCIAGCKPATNQSDTNAAPIDAAASTPTVSFIPQPSPDSACAGGVTAESPRIENRMLAANTISSTTEHTTLSLPRCAPAGACSSLASVGITSAATASIIRVAIVFGASERNVCVPFFRPPRKSAKPNTRSELPRMDPTSAALTTFTRPARSAKMHTNSSGRLPSADCRMPVAPGPRRLPSCSVASPTIIASDASAPAVITKVSTTFACSWCRTPASTVAATAAAITIFSFRSIMIVLCVGGPARIRTVPR